jgi:hypothetical protein
MSAWDLPGREQETAAQTMMLAPSARVGRGKRA